MNLQKKPFEEKCSEKSIKLSVLNSPFKKKICQCRLFGMKISMISSVELKHKEREKSVARKRSKITGVVLDHLEVMEGDAALFVDAFPSNNAIATIRKKRKKKTESTPADSVLAKE